MITIWSLNFPFLTGNQKQNRKQASKKMYIMNHVSFFDNILKMKPFPRWLWKDLGKYMENFKLWNYINWIELKILWQKTQEAPRGPVSLHCHKATIKSPNSPAPWWPCFLTNQHNLNEPLRVSPKEYFCKIIWKSAKYFGRRRFLKFTPKLL